MANSNTARNNRLNARVKPGKPQGIKTTTGQPRVPVSARDAAAVARSTVGKYPAGKPNTRPAVVSRPLAKVKPGPVVTSRTTPKTAAQRIAERAKANRINQAKIFNAPVPQLKKGIGSGGRDLPQNKADVVEIKVKPGDVDLGLKKSIDAREPAPKERMTQNDENILRAVGLREWRRGENPGPKVQAAQQAEADRRVAQGLKEIKIRESRLNAGRVARGGGLGGGSPLGGGGGGLHEQTR